VRKRTKPVYNVDTVSDTRSELGGRFDYLVGWRVRACAEYTTLEAEADSVRLKPSTSASGPCRDERNCRFLLEDHRATW
jgi:hypothetical protein